MKPFDLLHVDIEALTQSYLQSLTGLSLKELMNQLRTKKPRVNTLLYNNPENIEDGASGAILFLLELYEHSKDETLLTHVIKLCDELILYCQEHPTNNYGLYTGRCGVVYLLLRLHFLTSDRRFLEPCLTSVAGANGEYLTSNYTSDYLYNGRSGTLLTLTFLYNETKADFLLDYITQFAQAIIANAILSGEGVSWKGQEELNLRNSCGMAFGAAGIQYVLRLVNNYFPRAGFKYLIGLTGNYIDSCWLSDGSSWGNFEKDILSGNSFEQHKQAYASGDESILKPARDPGWASGHTGIMASFLYKKPGVEPLPVYTTEEISASSLYNGRAGLGLYFLESYYRSGNTEYLEEAAKVAASLLKEESGTNISGGLFHGKLGAAYFLARIQYFKKPVENILIPFARLIRKGETSARDLPIRLSTMRKALVARYFRRILKMMETIAPRAIATYFEAPAAESSEPEAFIHFIVEELKADTPAQPVLRDLFELERSRYHYICSDKKPNLQLYLAQSLHQDHSIRQLNHSDDWLMEQLLTILPDVEVRYSRWEWVRWEAFDLMENFHLPPQRYEYLFLPSTTERVMEYPLKIDSLILHFFDEPKRVKEAMTEIRTHCFASSAHNLKEFIQTTGSLHADDFLCRLHFLVLQKIKQLIYDRILIFR